VLNLIIFGREMKVSYVTQEFKQCINIKAICSNYILEFRNTNSHVM